MTENVAGTNKTMCRFVLSQTGCTVSSCMYSHDLAECGLKICPKCSTRSCLADSAYCKNCHMSILQQKPCFNHFFSGSGCLYFLSKSTSSSQAPPPPQSSAPSSPQKTNVCYYSHDPKPFRLIKCCTVICKRWINEIPPLETEFKTATITSKNGLF